MNAEKFSTAYQRDRLDTPGQMDAERARLLERPSQWSKAYGHILHDYLSGAPDPISRDDFRRLSTDYAVWYATELPELEEEAHRRAAQSNDHLDFRTINEMNFHALNRAMLPIWEDLLFTERGVQAASAKESQTVLAINGLLLYGEREEAVRRGEYFEPSYAEKRASHNGTLNEVDTAITLLNISLRNPDIIFLPAPEQFEHQASSRHSDFIAIQKSTRQARGIQTKVGVTNSSYDDYDPDYVTIVDGMRDLGNSYAVRTDARRSKKQIVGWPGLISLELLKSMKVDRNLRNLNPQYVTQSKFKARALNGNTKPYLQTATRQLSTRIINDLARTESEALITK
jgi:hypothetical protein